MRTRPGSCEEGRGSWLNFKERAMDENDNEPRGLLCVQCGADTDCNPDLSHMRVDSAKELLANWLCSDCLDERDEAEAAGVAEANIERLAAAAGR